MSNDQISDADHSTVPPTDSQPTPGLVGTDPKPGELPAAKAPWWRRYLIRGLKILACVVVVWLALAYVILPAAWKHYEYQPGLEDAPKTTLTPQGIPGDPLNVGLIGAEKVLVHAMLSSGWDPADPVTLRTSLRIAGSVLRDRPYPDAPVSSLFLFGRKQDLAFEKPVGKSASHRHHVRFWRSKEIGRNGAPLWLGSATYDRSVGLSHLTGQITHHIGPDIDAERGSLMTDLRKAGWLTELFQVTGVGSTLLGRNGGGDRYYTDGELTVGALAPAGDKDMKFARLENPVAIQFKQQFWSAIRPLLQSLPAQ
ncbi:LssY C-terminus [Singulisphaera sp. GP187]|uniref:LssY C-terminal domain-containing protein n=1 Tax=Singulisphaera sp. GP187 TaxID=1882752 RepID=UPI000927A268|nr:LssY C-terminal domain-containing protein [Singulisphaera sp. GP187]SIO61944.1 LssY C-terminus [Singulisphaera sp. GP187]